MDQIVDDVVQRLSGALPDQVSGLYVCGSAAREGPRPHSDVDLLAVVDRPLNQAQRKRLVDALLPISGWAGHADTYPEAAQRRPVEFSVVVVDDLRPVGYPPRLDFQYGEWLRGDLVAGAVPEPTADPDAVALLAEARQHHLVVCGPSLDALMDEVPPQHLRRACRDALPALLDQLNEDPRNVLLTLARMVVTVATATIVSKDQAAQSVSSRISPGSGVLLRRAAAEYRGEESAGWDKDRLAVQRAAEELKTLILETGAAPQG